MLKFRVWRFTKNCQRIEHPRKLHETRDPQEVMQYFGLKWMEKLKILKESKTHVLVNKYLVLPNTAIQTNIYSKMLI